MAACMQVVKILKGKYPPVPTRYTSHMRSLVDSMLKQNPKVRSAARMRPFPSCARPPCQHGRVANLSKQRGPGQPCAKQATLTSLTGA